MEEYEEWMQQKALNKDIEELLENQEKEDFPEHNK